MPGLTADSSNALVPVVPGGHISVVYPVHHGLRPPISRISISWSRGNSLRVSVFRQPSTVSEESDGEAGGKVVEVSLGRVDGEVSEEQWRRIAYGSVTPFALLQSRRNSVLALSKMSMISSRYHSQTQWWEFVMEYSKDISSLLDNGESLPDLVIDDPWRFLKKVEKPTSLKASWELLEIFYADKESHAWLPERIVDWLADYDILFSGTHTTIRSKLVEYEKFFSILEVIEDDPRYWEAMSSALAVGWLEIVVKLLRNHSSYKLDQLSNREVGLIPTVLEPLLKCFDQDKSELCDIPSSNLHIPTENGLVEAVAILISKMPRMRPELKAGRLGECFKTKPDFIKAREKWKAQIARLDESNAFWGQCDHCQTKEGLKNMLQIMLGNTSNLYASTCHWIELYISHLLYVMPFTVGLESMHALVQKCLQLKPISPSHRLMELLIAILGENTEVVLAECTTSFGPWLVAHAIELLTAGSNEAEIVLREEHDHLGGISMEELHRLVYAQVLSSHALTWQIAPIYLSSCMKQGMGLLEVLLYKQPVQHNQMLLKTAEICRLYDLETISSSIMKIAGVYHWKHGRKGFGVFWLQQAQDEFRLNKIAQQLFDFVGKSISDESFKQWEGLIELLGSQSKIAGGLDFLHKYRDFKKSLQQVHVGKTTDAALQAVESLMLLMKSPSTPQRFWLPILHDSLKLLCWQERPLLNVAQTNLLLNKLQELSIARLRPDFVEANLPPQALSSVRLALATNLGRAILEE